jgi:hypothetical protein
VTAVEWPGDTLGVWIPGASRVWRVRLTMLEGGSRRIEITAPG